MTERGFFINLTSTVTISDFLKACICSNMLDHSITVRADDMLSCVEPYTCAERETMSDIPYIVFEKLDRDTFYPDNTYR